MEFGLKKSQIKVTRNQNVIRSTNIVGKGVALLQDAVEFFNFSFCFYLGSEWLNTGQLCLCDVRKGMSANYCVISKLQSRN